MQKPLIVLTGPTGSGKTSLSLELAKKFKGEIVSADSMMVYKEMDIGTDKPKDFQGIPHHLIDIATPDEDFNVSHFVKIAKEIITEIQQRGNIPFLVGGSTLYIDAHVYGYSFPEVSPDLELRKNLEEQSAEEIFERLQKVDKDTSRTTDRSNKRRLVRALEVTLKVGHQKENKKNHLPNNVLYLALETDRAVLYDRIDRRVEEMIKNGLVEEVQRLVKKYRGTKAMEGAGYRQIAGYLAGDLELPQAIEKTKQAHRNYAKRQLTWLRKNPDVIWVKNKKEAEDTIKNWLK